MELTKENQLVRKGGRGIGKSSSLTDRKSLLTQQLLSNYGDEGEIVPLAGE